MATAIASPRWVCLTVALSLLLILSLGTVAVCGGRHVMIVSSEHDDEEFKAVATAPSAAGVEDQHAALAPAHAHAYAYAYASLTHDHNGNDTRKVRWLDMDSSKGTRSGVGQLAADVDTYITCESSDASPLASDATDAANYLISLNMQGCCNNSFRSCCTTMHTSGTAVLDICTQCQLEIVCMPCRLAGGFVLDVVNQCTDPTTGKVGGTINIDAVPPYVQFQVYHT